jgi:hypothetical protein
MSLPVASFHADKKKQEEEKENQAENINNNISHRRPFQW